MPTASLPYRTVTNACVDLGSWHYRTADGLLARVEDAVAGWDYDFDLELTRTFRVHPDQLREEAGLSRDAVVRLCITAVSAPARYRACVWRSEKMGGGGTHGAIDFSLSGRELAGSVSLETEIILASRGNPEEPFVAHLPGSRLFSERVNVHLEGRGSRFPLEFVDFATHLLYLNAPSALWYLSWNRADLSLPAMQDLRLYLNSRNEKLVEAARLGDPTLVAMLSVDVARRLVNGALDNDEFLEHPAEFPEGSTADVARRLIDVCFPGTRVRDVAALRRSNPSKYEAMIQSGGAGVEW